MVFGSRGEEEEKMMEHKGLFGLGDGKVGGQKIIGGWKSERIEKNLVFLRMCVVGEMEMWRDEKLLYLAEKKNEKMKNIVSTNLLLYPYYIKHYFFLIFNYITHKYINMFISK